MVRRLLLWQEQLCLRWFGPHVVFAGGRFLSLQGCFEEIGAELGC
ncbi:Hypothetical protein CulFRC58_1500 [Corynebacterium ulcerans FRC58]|uniref:Transposase n=1 Tax=Corynebacterium ulcerans FRC58 TaxID=1408268 RepID=A0ABM5U299_CORUL|nr:Hypothetical protein CulFRC58_1500 [Corynebacterium ulcerans FRC58]